MAEVSSTKYVVIGSLSAQSCHLVVKNSAEFTQDIKEQNYSHAENSSIENILREFLKEFEGTDRYPSGCIFSLDETATTWVIDENDLEAKLNLKVVKKLSDIQATGYGILTLNESEQCRLLNSDNGLAENSQKGVMKVFIDVGLTSLSQAILMKSAGPEGRYDSFATQGGRAGFAPRGRLQFEFSLYALEKAGMPICTYDMALSGSAMTTWYQFLATKFPELAEKSNELLGTKEPSMAQIFDESDKDELCQKVVDEISDVYATEIANMAARTLCTSGVYVAGDLTTAGLDKVFNSQIFKDSLNSKFDMLPPLKDIPVFYIDTVNLQSQGSFEFITRFA